MAGICEMIGVYTEAAAGAIIYISNMLHDENTFQF
jgi:hypothetical protein